MQIIGATEHEIKLALESANNAYDNNLVFKTCHETGNSRNGKPKHTVTLTVKSSKAKGAKRNPANGRRVAAACWHAHGDFMAALPAGTRIKTSCGMSGMTEVVAPEVWGNDWGEGSKFEPYYASEACECNGEWD